MSGSPRLFYICYEFPVLTQTFTMNEVRELRRLGTDLTVVTCRPAGDGAEPPVLDLGAAVSAASIRSLLKWFVVRPLRLLSLFARVATARYRDEPVKCWARGFKQFLWGLKLADRTAREGGRIHYHAQFVDAASTVAWVAARLTDRPFTVTNHTAYNPYLLRPKLKSAAAFLSISEFDRELTRRMAGTEGTIRVVYQGIDTEAFPPSPPSAPGRPVRILSVAALREKKGHHVLVEAVAGLVRSGREVRLTIVGEGPERERIEGMVERLGLGDHVELVGAEAPDRVRERLAEADVFALACVEAANGDVDGIPISLMEAMAAGVPVVSTRLSGIPELVEDGVEGLLAEPGDAAGLAAGIEAVLSDPEHTAGLTKRAREKVERQHDLRASAERFLAVLAEVSR